MGDYTFKISDYGNHTLVFNNFGDEVSPHSLVAEIDSLQSRLAHLENLIDERDNKILSLDNECHGLQSQLLEYKSMHTEMQEDIQTFLSEINDLHQQLSEIRGVAGYPAKDELKKRGLTDSLADIIRCNHQRYMEATHRAEQREIAAQIQVDSLQSQLSEAMAQIERLRSACQLGIDMMAANDLDLPKTLETMYQAMMEAPAQSLAEIKAQAIEEAIDKCAWHNDRTWMKIDDIKDYAARLRKQGKG